MMNDFSLKIRLKKDCGARTMPIPVLHDAFKFLFEEIKALLDIFESFPAGQNDFPGREEERDNLWILDTVYKARELLGFRTRYFLD